MLGLFGVPSTHFYLPCRTNGRAPIRVRNRREIDENISFRWEIEFIAPARSVHFGQAVVIRNVINEVCVRLGYQEYIIIESICFDLHKYIPFALSWLVSYQGVIGSDDILAMIILSCFAWHFLNESVFSEMSLVLTLQLYHYILHFVGAVVLLCRTNQFPHDLILNSIH